MKNFKAHQLWDAWRDAQSDAAGRIQNEPDVPTQEEIGRVLAFLGRIGGKKGGKVRASRLTAERRSEIAQLAAKARWCAKKTL